MRRRKGRRQEWPRDTHLSLCCRRTTQAAGAIHVLVRAWLYVSLSLLWPIDVLVYNPFWDFEGVIMTLPCDRVVWGQEREGGVWLGLWGSRLTDKCGFIRTMTALLHFCL